MGDEAAERSMNPIIQGHARVLCHEGNGEHRGAFKEGFSFVRKVPSGISMARVETRVSTNDLL